MTEPPRTTTMIRTDRRSCPSAHSFANKAGRALWALVWVLLFRPSPALLRGWRRFLLRCFGAKIGPGAKIMPSARIWAPWNLEMGEQATLAQGVDCYCVAPVRIGAHATVSQRAFLCAASHDTADAAMKLITAPIVIGPSAWVCAEAFVAMGVTLGEGAVAGARAVVTKDVGPWEIVAGNPARFVKRREIRS